MRKAWRSESWQKVYNSGMNREDIRTFAAFLLLALAGAGTFLLSGWIEGGASNAANAFLSASTVHEVSLYADKAVPAELSVRVGDEVLFVVEEGFHNIAEERTNRRDARLESGQLDPSTSYSLRFNSSGDFYLYDRQNLDIRITIRVEE